MLADVDTRLLCLRPAHPSTRPPLQANFTKTDEQWYERLGSSRWGYERGHTTQRSALIIDRVLGLCLFIFGISSVTLSLMHLMYKMLQSSAINSSFVKRIMLSSCYSCRYLICETVCCGDVLDNPIYCTDVTRYCVCALRRHWSWSCTEFVSLFFVADPRAGPVGKQQWRNKKKRMHLSHCSAFALIILLLLNGVCNVAPPSKNKRWLSYFQLPLQGRTRRAVAICSQNPSVIHTGVMSPSLFKSISR